MVEPGGTPASGLSFWLSTGPQTSRTIRAEGVDDGVFDLWLEPGERRVSVVREGFRADPVEVRIAEGGTVAREVQLQEVVR